MPQTARPVAVSLGYRFAIVADRPMPAHVVALAQPYQRPPVLSAVLHEVVSTKTILSDGYS